MAERTSTVRGRARAAARERTAAVWAARRQREDRVVALVASHAEDLALVDAHQLQADRRVLELVEELGEPVASVAELLGVEPPVVRAALKRARVGGSVESPGVEDDGVGAEGPSEGEDAQEAGSAPKSAGADAA
jgi:hypothetical protein